MQVNHDLSTSAPPWRLAQELVCSFSEEETLQAMMTEIAATPPRPRSKKGSSTVVHTPQNQSLELALLWEVFAKNWERGIKSLLPGGPLVLEDKFEVINWLSSKFHYLFGAGVG